MKYDKEKTEIELFLKSCNLKDFIHIIITIFKDKYANGSLLGALISETIKKEKNRMEHCIQKNFNIGMS